MHLSCPLYQWLTYRTCNRHVSDIARYVRHPELIFIGHLAVSLAVLENASWNMYPTIVITLLIIALEFY